MLRRPIVIRPRPGGMNALKSCSIWCVCVCSPWNLLCAHRPPPPSKMTSSRAGQLEHSHKTWIRQGALEPITCLD